MKRIHWSNVSYYTRAIFLETEGEAKTADAAVRNKKINGAKKQPPLFCSGETVA